MDRGARLKPLPRPYVHLGVHGRRVGRHWFFQRGGFFNSQIFVPGSQGSGSIPAAAVLSDVGV